MLKESTVLRKHIAVIVVITAVILLIPLIAMQFSREVNWQLNDFVIMGALLFITGLGIDAVIIKARTNKRRVAYGALIVLLFLYIWAELAVGIFTNLGS